MRAMSIAKISFSFSLICAVLSFINFVTSRTAIAALTQRDFSMWSSSRKRFMVVAPLFETINWGVSAR